jgi:hypothetical protein
LNFEPLGPDLESVERLDGALGALAAPVGHEPCTKINFFLKIRHFIKAENINRFHEIMKDLHKQSS